MSADREQFCNQGLNSCLFWVADSICVLKDQDFILNQNFEFDSETGFRANLESRTRCSIQGPELNL